MSEEDSGIGTSLARSEERYLEELKRRLRRDRLLISLSYLVLGILWMYFSSGIYIPYVLHLESPAVRLEVIKEILFVVVTAGLLYYTLGLLHRRQLALAEKLAQAKLEEAELEYMRELTSLVGGITHDLRNILQLIGLHLSTREELSPEEFRRRTELVTEELKRIARLCDTMTAAAAGAVGGRTVDDVDLARFVEREIELVRPLIRRGTITLEAADDLHPVRANLITLHRLLLNLLYNACQAAGEEGRVRITLSNLNGRISIGVENTGRPLPGEVVEALNTELELSSLIRQSHGWGLGIVMEATRELNARIRAEPIPKGSRIEVIMSTQANGPTVAPYTR